MQQYHQSPPPGPDGYMPAHSGPPNNTSPYPPQGYPPQQQQPQQPLTQNASQRGAWHTAATGGPPPLPPGAITPPPPSSNIDAANPNRPVKPTIAQRKTDKLDRQMIVTKSADEETEDGRIRNREAMVKIRDAWIYKQIRLRQDEFTQYKQVCILMCVCVTKLHHVHLHLE
jgi:hypothetical protein